MKKALALVLAALLTLSGCSQTDTIYANFRAVEDLQLVQTFGFDWEDGEITVTVSSGEETDKLPSSLLSASAPDIPQAIEKLQDWSAREDLFFAHIRYVLVGEEAARHGLETLLDWFERGIQTRLDLPIFVVEGGTARELISGSSDKLYKLMELFIEKGILSDWFLYCDTAFRISPPLTITNDEIADCVALITECLNDL